MRLTSLPVIFYFLHIVLGEEGCTTTHHDEASQFGSYRRVEKIVGGWQEIEWIQWCSETEQYLPKWLYQRIIVNILLSQT